MATEVNVFTSEKFSAITCTAENFNSSRSAFFTVRWIIFASSHITLRFVLASLALFVLDMPQAFAISDYPSVSCIGTHCYGPDFLGGLGLYPARHYKIAYGKNKVCTVVRDAVNKAIRAGNRSLEAVSKPLPESALSDQGPTWPWHGKPVTKYETRNPIFASDIFLPWNWMAWEPWPGATPWSGNELKDDYSRARWMIAPVFNDGKRHLMTQGKPGSGIKVWDVPDDELDGHDWSDWKSYENYRPLVAYCKFVSNAPLWVGPFEQFSSPCPIASSERAPLFSKLPLSERKRYPFSVANPAISLFTLSLIDERYYIILQPAYQDLIIVDDAGNSMPSPDKYGDFSENMDLCYLIPSLENN
jgi:hypothetical protein